MNQEERTQRHKELCTKLNVIYTEKNIRYGNSFDKTYDKYGPTALLLRLEDKFARVTELLLDPELEPLDESIEDTLIDLANYALMGIIKLEIDADKHE